MVESFPISNRTKNALISAGYKEVEDFKDKYLDDLKNIEGLGNKGLLEIREYLAVKYNFTFKLKPKPKVIQDYKGSKELIDHFLGKRCCDWANQMKIADRLIKKYGKDYLLKIKPLDKVYSLVYYLTGYGEKHLRTNLEVRVVKLKEEHEEEVPDIVYAPVESDKPKTLKDFLGL